MYNTRFKQIRRLTPNTVECLKQKFSSTSIHQKFRIKSKKNYTPYFYQSQTRTISSNVSSQKQAIRTASLEQKDSKYATNTLPARKRVVICGGGVMGAAVAYHLGLRGWADETVVLEKGR